MMTSRSVILLHFLIPYLCFVYNNPLHNFLFSLNASLYLESIDLRYSRVYQAIAIHNEPYSKTVHSGKWHSVDWRQCEKLMKEYLGNNKWGICGSDGMRPRLISVDWMPLTDSKMWRHPARRRDGCHAFTTQRAPHLV